MGHPNPSILSMYGQSTTARIKYDRPNQERAVIDGTYNGSESGAPESLNIEHVRAVYDCPNQVETGDGSAIVL